MKGVFIASLCHNGILGGGLYLDDNSIIYRTNKLTVDARYRNLVLPLDRLERVEWNWVIFPIATFYMRGGEKFTFIIFNKWRFEKYLSEAWGQNSI